jgi:hypothetical protein
MLLNKHAISTLGTTIRYRLPPPIPVSQPSRRGRATATTHHSSFITPRAPRHFDERLAASLVQEPPLRARRNLPGSAISMSESRTEWSRHSRR